MKTLSRLIPTLAVVSLVAACGSSEASVDRSAITATPTTAPSAPPPPVASDAPTTDSTDDDPTDEATATSDAPETTDADDATLTTEADSEAVTTEPESEAVTTEAGTETTGDGDVGAGGIPKDVVVSQLLLLGYTEEEADCLADEVDLTDPRVIELDPEVVLPPFEICNADPTAFLALADA